jgi:hypothetical protein
VVVEGVLKIINQRKGVAVRYRSCVAIATVAATVAKVAIKQQNYKCNNQSRI